MANEKTPVVWDDSTKKHRPLGTGEKMGGLDASSIISSDSGNLIGTGSDGLAYVTGSGIADPAADNLLETTAQGKLKMDVDRLAEWLDGHPADAKTLSEAIKVVSGDSGNVISKGTDKGAYLSAAALASVIGGMSAAQLQQLASALADGQTIVASGGKLVVDPTTAPKAKLQAITTALRKSGGGLSVDSATGKLSVDFASMDPAIMRAVVLSMVQQGGGLAVDQNGQLFVDFDTMPTDKFEALLKSLKMQVPLEANKSFYVATNDPNASDTLVEGRGTEALPFKTIQACINYATQNYAAGRYTMYIRIKPGTYAENLNLPTITRTSGGAQLRAYDMSDPPVLTNATNSGSVIYVSGSGWSLNRVSVTGSRTANNDGLSHYPHLVYMASTGTLVVTGTAFSDSFSGPATSSGYELMRLFELRGGQLQFTASNEYDTTIHVEKGNANACEVFTIGSGGTVVSYSTNDEAAHTDIVCDGTFTTFASVSSSGVFNLVGGGLYQPHFVVADGRTATGKRYSVTTGGGISLTDGGTLPGDVEGTASSETYGWYVGGSLNG